MAGEAFVPPGAGGLTLAGKHAHGQRLQSSTNSGPTQKFARRSIIRAVMTPTQAEAAGVKLSKVEYVKEKSDYLLHPVEEEMQNEEIFVSEDSYQLLKFHGTYQQDQRDLRRPGQQKVYQFMLRVKMPAGEMPPEMYLTLDDLSDTYGNGTLRATTRCAFQMHGVLKHDLKKVFSTIMNAGGSTIGACGDISRNVVATPAAFSSKPYQLVREYSKMIAEVFAPQTESFAEVWLDGEKAASVEYWRKDIDMKQVQKIIHSDPGDKIVDNSNVEPIYRETYLPRKFKIGVTLPGDNSIDVYTQDITVVVMTTKTGRLQGFNIMVGGGLGRTHRKDVTFPRLADHLGFVEPNRLFDVLKAIVAVQRDHGNRELRINARMKYLVEKWGIDKFRYTVEEYADYQLQPYRNMVPWEYRDYLGWHEQGDGRLFLGLFIENGRIKNEGEYNIKRALKEIVSTYKVPVVVSPMQNMMLKDIRAEDKAAIEDILGRNGVKFSRKDFSSTRLLSMACPAFPLCGLATTEAERVAPTFVTRLDDMLKRHRLRTPIVMRITGCPNGCARPYMAEIGLVGNGPDTYQLWLGACPNQTRLAWVLLEKMKGVDFENTLEPLLMYYKLKKRRTEAFGDFCERMGKDELLRVVENPGEVADVGAPKTASAKPRVSVNSLTMDKLNRVAQLREMTASQLANEILVQYIDGLHEEVQPE